MFTFISLGFYLRGYLINISDINAEHECAEPKKKKESIFSCEFFNCHKNNVPQTQFYLQYSMCINLFLQSFFRTISNIEEMYS